MSEARDADPRPGRGRSFVWVFLVLLGSLLPLLTNPDLARAPWIAEDASILRFVHAAGPFADGGGPQYGLLLVRFWRPLVTLSWDLQEAWTGIDPLPLRLFNLLVHAGAALAVGVITRRLSGSRWAAGLAGLWAASFPFQGGIVLWLAGRTDLLGGACMVASLAALLANRRSVGLPLAFAACASKEFGFLLPLWLALLEASRGHTGRDLLWRVLPTTLVVGVAFLCRALALGVLVGGYPAPPTPLAADLAGFGQAVAATAGPALLAVLGLALVGWYARTLHPRLLLSGGACFALGVLPLYPLLKAGPLSPQNERLFYVAELGLALAAGATLARWPARGRRGLLVPVAALLVLGLRFPLATADLRAWAEAARVGESRVAAARAAVASAAPGSGPVLVQDLPTSHGPAYCLGFGAADRFRSPFPPSPRPVWPWRPLFGFEASRRAAAFSPRGDGTLWPLDVEVREVPLLRLSTLPSLPVDERVLAVGEDTSPRVEVLGSFPSAGFEAVLFTELGYEPLPWRPAGPGETHTLTLRELMSLSNGTVSGGQTLMQAADLAARRAYLELRVVAADGTLEAASRWIELAWEPGFLRTALGE